MSADAYTCEYCSRQFDGAAVLARHEEREHGATTSLGEQALSEHASGEEFPTRSQADLLVGLGEAGQNHGETEAPDRNDRNVHRPPTPGPG